MTPDIKTARATRSKAPRMGSGMRGFTLVELMIAVALGLVILAALTSFFVQTSQNRSELDRNSRQIENGRFAADLLREDLSLAGFYADLNQPVGTSWQTPAACTTVVGSLGFTPSLLNPLVPVPIFGYAQGVGAPVCLTNLVAGTDVLVVRRLNTERTAAAAPLASQYYLQVSECATDNPATPFVFDSGANAASFALHKLDCVALADLWRYREHVYYIRGCSICGTDTIPTLVRLELNGAAVGEMTVVPLVEGIQDMRIDYGMDTNSNGIPDIWRRCDAALPCVAGDWKDVVALKVNLIARNLEGSPGYVDTKTYDLGLSGTVAASGDNVKRQVYRAVVNLNNRSGLREAPYDAWPAAAVDP
jgi:type IV pilus assembly protein PilW